MLRTPSLFRCGLLACCVIASPAAAQERGAPPAERPSIHSRMPARFGPFTLTQRLGVQGTPGDSLYRYQGEPSVNLSVVVYDMDSTEQLGTDPARWLVAEGEKFKEIMALRQQSGEIESFRVAFAHTKPVVVRRGTLTEHRTVALVRDHKRVVSMNMQFLYLIDGTFVKVRATMPAEGYEQSLAPSFAYYLAQYLVDAPVTPSTPGR